MTLRDPLEQLLARTRPVTAAETSDNDVLDLLRQLQPVSAPDLRLPQPQTWSWWSEAAAAALIVGSLLVGSLAKHATQITDPSSAQAPDQVQTIITAGKGNINSRLIAAQPPIEISALSLGAYSSTWRPND